MSDSSLRDVERLAGAADHHVDARGTGLDGFLHALRTLARTLLAIEHVRTRDLVLARAHHRELDLVLHVFDMERAARGMAAHQRLHHGLREGRDLVAHAGAHGGGVARHGEERLRHRHRDLVGLEAHDRAVPANDLVVRVSLRTHRTRFLAEDRVGEGGGGADIGCKSHERSPAGFLGLLTNGFIVNNRELTPGFCTACSPLHPQHLVGEGSVEHKV